MAFLRGKKPCLRLTGPDHHGAFRAALVACGYRVHRGPRTRARGEIRAWVVPIGQRRQVHVQEVAQGQEIAVFAHTEPAGYGIRHLTAALFDRVSYGAGARALLADLRSEGWRV